MAATKRNGKLAPATIWLDRAYPRIRQLALEAGL